jgi:hypothetical protein
MNSLFSGTRGLANPCEQFVSVPRVAPMSASSRSLALRAYAGLLRVQRQCFKNDPSMRVAAALETRKQFDAHRGEKDEEEIDTMIHEAIDLVGFLKHNMVQVQKKPDGVFQMKLEQRHTLEAKPPTQ